MTPIYSEYFTTRKAIINIKWELFNSHFIQFQQCRLVSFGDSKMSESYILDVFTHKHKQNAIEINIEN